MQQLHLFEPTFQQRIEEFLNERIEDYFVTSSLSITEKDDLYLRHCKVLTKKHVYDVTISESYDYDSEINHQVNRKELHNNFITSYFAKYKQVFARNFVE